MTIHRTQNQAGLGGNHFVWWLYKTWVTAGCTVHSSGSGTGGTYSGAGGGDVFDPAGGNPMQYSVGAASGKLGSGAGTEPWVGAPRAWLVISYLDGTQWLFQRDIGALDTDDDEWIIAWAPGGFNLAGCNANTAPAVAAAGTLRLFCGTINGAGQSMYATGGTANMIHIAVDDVASPDGRYGCMAMEFVNPNTLKGVFFIDDLRQAKSDLFLPMAQVMGCGGGAVNCFTADYLARPNAAVNYPRAVVDYGGGGESFDPAAYLRLVDFLGNVIYPNAGGTPAAGQPDFPMIAEYHLHGNVFGMSRWFKWQAQTQTYPDTNVALTEWYVGHVAVAIGDGVTIPAGI